MNFAEENDKIDKQQDTLTGVEAVESYEEIWQTEVDKIQAFCDRYASELEDDTLIESGLERIALLLTQVAIEGERAKPGEIVLKNFMTGLEKKMAEIRGEVHLEEPPTPSVPVEDKPGFAQIDEDRAFHDRLESFKTEEERRAFLDELMAANQEAAEIELSPQQLLRLEQVELLQTFLSALAREVEGNGKLSFLSWFSGLNEQESANKAGKYRELAEEVLPRDAMKIALDPTCTLESLEPTLLSNIREASKIAGDQGLVTVTMGVLRGIDTSESLLIDLKDVSSPEDLDRQTAQVARFLQSMKQYEEVRRLAEKSMYKEIEAAKDKLPNELKEALRSEAEKKISKLKEKNLAQWKSKGMSDEQIDVVTEKLIKEQFERDVSVEALKKQNFDPLRDIPPSKKAIWSIYNEVFDPQDEAGNISEEHFDFILEEIMINAPLIVASGGAAGLARAGLSAGTRSFLEGSRLAIYAGRATEASRATALTIRGAGIMGGLAVEGTAFELVHSGLAKAIGVEEKWLFDLTLPKATERILWSCASLGLFHGVGKVAGSLGTSVDRGIARQVMKNVWRIENPAQFKLGLEILTKKISDGPTRKLIQQVVISGNLEAATMLLIGAAQSGFYAGNLDEFFEQFEEQLFHAYVAAGSLKLAGGLTTLSKERKGNELPSETRLAREMIEQNSKLKPAQRIEMAEVLLGRNLNPVERAAILEAHAVGSEGTGKYTPAELRQKVEILDKTGFNAVERRTLMESGITGIWERVMVGLGVFGLASFETGQMAHTAYGTGEIVQVIMEGRDTFYLIRCPDGSMEKFGDAYLRSMSARAERAAASGDLWKTVQTPKGVGFIVGRLEDGRFIVNLGGKDVDFFKREEFSRVVERVEVKEPWRASFDLLTSQNRLTSESAELLRAGLTPSSTLRVGAHEFFLSDVYKVKGYLQVVAYVNVGGEVQPRFFYKSLSAGEWRSAPAVGNKQTGAFSKGLDYHYTQETRIVPELEYKLDQLATDTRPSPTSISALFDLGPGRHPNMDQYNAEIRPILHPGLAKVRAELQPGMKKLYIEKGTAMPDSQVRDYVESIGIRDFPPGFIPNFNVPVKPVRKHHPILGPIDIYVYKATLDGRPIEWHMAKDLHKRAWVDLIAFSSVETSSFGTRAEVIDSGILTAKPIEYAIQAYGVEGTDFVRIDVFNGAREPKNQYVDQQYLLRSLLPIRLFLQATGS